jgi:prephenate dehydrogenase
MKVKKILIVGLGGMGRSHLKSFLDSNKKYEIDLVDKKKIRNFQRSYYF